MAFVLWLYHLINIIGRSPTYLFLKKKAYTTTVIVVRELRTFRGQRPDCKFTKFLFFLFLSF